MTVHDEELRDLIDRWQSAQPAMPDGREDLRRHVRRRRAQIQAWIVADVVVGVAGMAVLAAVVATSSSLLERVSLATLLLVVAGALAFSWWNWRGTLRAVGESTTVFVELSRMRLERVRRALRVGWVLLVAEGLLFVPFVWVRTGGASPTVVWPWVFLAAMLALAAAGLVAAGRWAAREQVVLEALEHDADS